MKAWLAIVLLLTSAASASENRFPQPVRVGDLIGRKLIGPAESQPLLGHVEGVDRRDGTLALRIQTWSLLPWRGRSVEVPIDSVSLLGRELALTGLTAAQLTALPEAAAPMPVASDETIRVGLVRPFH